MLIEAIDKGAVPGFERFIVVPGNHDVLRGTQKGSVRLRWNEFMNFSEKFVRPWIPDADPDIPAMTAAAQTTCLLTSRLWGRVTIPARKTIGGNLPFLLDRDHNILFYAFNSASISGTKVELPPGIEEHIKWFQGWNDPNKFRVQNLISAYEQELNIDPARIDPRVSIIYSYEWAAK